MDFLEYFHTNLIEISWAVIAVVVLAFAFYGLRESIIDSAFLLANKVNGPRKLTAEMNKREETFRLSQTVVMLLYAIGALILPPPPPNYSEQPQTLVGLLAWMMVGLLMIADSLMARAARKKLQQYVPVEMSTSDTVVLTPQPGETKAELEGRVVEARQAIDQNRRDGDSQKRRVDDLHDSITTDIPPEREK